MSYGIERGKCGLGGSAWRCRGCFQLADAGGSAQADFTTQFQSSLKVTSTPAWPGGRCLQEFWLLFNGSTCLGDGVELWPGLPPSNTTPGAPH